MTRAWQWMGMALIVGTSGCGASPQAPRTVPERAPHGAPAARPSEPVEPSAPREPSPPAQPASPVVGAEARQLELATGLVDTMQAAGDDCTDIAHAVSGWLETHAADYAAAREAVAESGATAEHTLRLDAQLDGVFTLFALCDGNPDTGPLYERVRALTTGVP